VVVVVAVAVVVTVRYRPDAPSVRRISDERAAPTFAIPDLRDEASTVDLRAFRGRPVVLNFWASWCVPCRNEMPAFEAMRRRIGDRVAFVGVNHQDSRDDALELLGETGVGYPSGFDPQGRVAQAYALYGMPTTVFISADGRILASRTGEMSESQLHLAIRDLFAVASSSG
jgi:cytochrome c biogenesis protein CcmG/thiol:disulfide interchange protein DsbE